MKQNENCSEVENKVFNNVRNTANKYGKTLQNMDHTEAISLQVLNSRYKQICVFMSAMQ